MRIILFILFYLLLSATSGLANQRLSKWIPDDVHVLKGLVYSKHKNLKLDLYLPKGDPEKARPCVIVIHGGAWKFHDRKWFAAHAATFAQNGFAAISIDYRKYPQHKIIDAVNDCKEAVRWIRRHKHVYPFDTDRIAAFGGSAGGHLAAMLATASTVAHQDPLQTQKVSSQIHAAVAMAAPTNLAVPKVMVAFRMGFYEAKQVSPIDYASEHSAPMLLMHSTKDRVVPYFSSSLMLRRLKQQKADVQLVRFQRTTHDFWNRPRYFKDTMQRSIDYLKKKLAG